MPKRQKQSAARAQARATNISAHPLTPDQLITGIFQISKEDVRKVLASKPGKKK